MSLAVRYGRDEVAALIPLAGMRVVQKNDVRFMARLQGKPERDIQQRFAEGHRAYVAMVDGQPAGWGWVATRSARIGELETSFDIPRGARYLWNFVTLPGHRGKGIYPRLLDAIVRTESGRAEQFWIAYAPENCASAAGIYKAGFTKVATLSFSAAGAPAVIGVDYDGGLAAASLLGLPQSSGAISQCWRCARTRTSDVKACAATSCCCDYQNPEISC